MKIFIGADHRGFEIKEALVGFLQEQGFEVDDKGAYVHEPEDDYPDFVFPVAREVAVDPEKNRGVVLGYSGQGEAIAANKISGVRAVVYYGGDKKIVELSRKHNDANVLSLGAGFISVEEAKEAVKLWLNTGFSADERHERRLVKIEAETGDSSK